MGLVWRLANKKIAMTASKRMYIILLFFNFVE